MRVTLFGSNWLKCAFDARVVGECGGLGRLEGGWGLVRTEAVGGPLCMDSHSALPGGTARRIESRAFGFRVTPSSERLVRTCLPRRELSRQ